MSFGFGGAGFGQSNNQSSGFGTGSGFGTSNTGGRLSHLFFSHQFSVLFVAHFRSSILPLVFHSVPLILVWLFDPSLCRQQPGAP